MNKIFLFLYIIISFLIIFGIISLLIYTSNLSLIYNIEIFLDSGTYKIFIFSKIISILGLIFLVFGIMIFLFNYIKIGIIFLSLNGFLIFLFSLLLKLNLSNENYEKMLYKLFNNCSNESMNIFKKKYQCNGLRIHGCLEYCCDYTISKMCEFAFIIAEPFLTKILWFFCFGYFLMEFLLIFYIYNFVKYKLF